MSRAQYELYPLAAEDRERLAEPLARTFAEPDRDAMDLREVVRDIAHRALEAGWASAPVVQALRLHVDSVANDDLPFLTYNRVLERIILWSLTVYHRPDAGRRTDNRTSA